ncbi:MAG: ATP-binding protein [Timaviella obliquedivisa GSE-PSE-MK23-08B]|jgi:hypothetical protein|nr:ATP-binding protein [Timaviella obliquedivisa GSE-PSE-MK23-08B]
MSESVSASIEVLQRQVAALLLYQSVFDDEIGQAFLRLLQVFRQQSKDELACLETYGQWFRTMAAAGLSWQDYLLTQITRADNPFTRGVQRVPHKGSPLSELPPALVLAARQDLRGLQSLYQCSGHQFNLWMKARFSFSAPLVEWTTPCGYLAEIAPTHALDSNLWRQFQTLEDWTEILPDLADYYRQAGVGVFATHHAFRWQNGQFAGIAHPDPVRLRSLVGYEIPRAALLKNTEALLAGYPALNVLLYGSRGTGKSSLVKALVHEYGDRGLRLIEVGKANLKDLPTIVEQLRLVPHRFIIFVDDLSFEEDDESFKALKVVLEGSLTARPENVAVYATSNRRHLVREFYGDRPTPKDADEIHHWDTLQEKLSFSDRFGLTLTFEPADQTTYLEIVRHLVKEAAIEIRDKDLEFRALQWATRQNGRSGRTARQFVDFLRADQAH